MAFERLAEAAERRRDEFIELARWLYENPELSHEEHKAQARLVEYLRNNGFRVETGIAGYPTSFRAEYGDASRGPTVCIIAEYDALAGLGHGCGHNLIGTSGVGTGIVLKDAFPDIPGRIVVLGTPAEEVPPPVKGIMYERGAFEGVDMMVMFHGNDVTTTRMQLLALDAIEFHFKGKPSHASAKPQDGISALDAVMLTAMGIEFLREHVHPEARIHGIVTNGGQAANIVPEFASARYMVRAPRRRHVEEIAERVRNCARGAALATGAELEIEEIGQYWDHLHVPSLDDRLLDYAVRAGAKQVKDTEMKASNDMGAVTYHMPAACLCVAMVPEGITQHTHEFLEASGGQEGFDAMMVGIKAMAATCHDFIVDEAFRRAVLEQHAREVEQAR